METCYASFYNMHLSQVSLRWSFSPKYPTDNSLYHFENTYFVWKQKHAFVMNVSLNANELMLPAQFSRIGLCLYSLYLRYSAKRYLFGFDYYVYHAEIMHTSEARAQKADVTWCVSTISFLPCLIAHRLSITHIKPTLKTHELQKALVMSVKVNSWERNCMFILDLCGSSIQSSK